MTSHAGKSIMESPEPVDCGITAKKLIGSFAYLDDSNSTSPHKLSQQGIRGD
jgi:hypothetical protein